MVRLLDLPTASTFLLLSTLALSSPLPQPQRFDRGRHANQHFGGPQGFNEPCRTESRIDTKTFVHGSGRSRSTEIIYTTYTTVVYTTDTFTTAQSPAAIQVPPSSPPLTGPGVPGLTTGTDTITNSLGSPETSSRATINTVPSSASNVSMTSFSSSSTIPSPTTAGLNATASSTLFSNATTSVSASNSSSTPAAVTEVSTCPPAPLPAGPTNSGTVEGCTLWYVAQPDDNCSTVAQEFGVSVETFMRWNPSVLPPTCPNLMAGDSYCVRVCGAGPSSTSVSSGSAAATLSSISTAQSASNPATTSTSVAASSSAAASPSASAGLDVYRAYAGDGTAAAGWPTESQWVTFDYMFTSNSPQMLVSCEAWGVPDNSEAEMSILREQILSVGEATAIDPRFVLAIIMQESTGCVRVITSAYSHANPGLMQSFNGTGSCNSNAAGLGIPGVAGDGVVQTPCPESEIRQQILDGTNGTVWGPGLVQDMAEQGNTDSSRWYRTARLYNGGSIVDADLSQPCCTPSYASDIANRLTGWVKAPRVFP